jgi:glutamine synthetase
MSATEEMEARLREDGIRNVVLEFADINGVSRSKQVSTDYFLRSWETGFSIPVAILACSPLTVPAEGSGVAEAINYADGHLHPVPSTLKPVPWRDRTVRVLCEFTRDGEPVGCDPRYVLDRTLDRLGAGIEFAVGSELEFYLFDPDGDGGWVPRTPHEHECVTWAMEEADGFYARLADWAEAYGIPLDLFMHEYGSGQFEALFDYGDPREQADLAFDYKRLVKATARSRDERATFMAKPIADQSGSGYHLHVSGWDGEENAFAGEDGRLSETGRRFVGGVLEHADALVALQCPSINAYKRFQPGGFVPYTASWGYDNRMAGVRIPIDEPRVEVRLGSADANPYVVIASTLAAGAHGIQEGIDPGEPIDDRDPAGDRPALERTPELALRALEDDDVLVDALGEAFVRAYAAVRRQGIEDFYDRVTDYEFETFGEMY